jgi:GTP 3',8-cyclase
LSVLPNSGWRFYFDRSEYKFRLRLNVWLGNSDRSRARLIRRTSLFGRHRLTSASLADSFGRVHRSVRISITDRCNIRCFYCMPAGDIAFAPRQELLSFEEITRVVSVLAGAGVHDVRLTGGEPLVRRDVERLVGMIAAVPGVRDLAMTTNAILLPQFALQLREAGLKRLNISLDTLDEETFRRITRRQGLQRVLDGIDAAIDAGFEQIRLNALAIRGSTEDELESLVRFAAARSLTMRFIEYMPLDATRAWTPDQVLSGDEIVRRLADCFGRLLPLSPPQAAQPARDYALIDLPKNALGEYPRVGLIRPVTQPFCGACDRIRITAEGTIRNCLFSDDEWDLRSLLRSGASDRDLLERVAAAVSAKQAGHLISRPGFSRPARAMYRIGG